MSGFHESTCVSSPFCECAAKRIAALEAALERSDRALKSTPSPRLYSVEEVERALRVAYPVVRDGAVPGWWPDFRAALKGKP